jgi:hypothetical protein
VNGALLPAADGALDAGSNRERETPPDRRYDTTPREPRQRAKTGTQPLRHRFDG